MISNRDEKSPRVIAFGRRTSLKVYPTAQRKKRSIAMATLNDPSETHGRLIAASKVNGTTV